MTSMPILLSLAKIPSSERAHLPRPCPPEFRPMPVTAGTTEPGRPQQEPRGSPSSSDKAQGPASRSTRRESQALFASPATSLPTGKGETDPACPQTVCRQRRGLLLRGQFAPGVVRPDKLPQGIGLIGHHSPRRLENSVLQAMASRPRASRASLSRAAASISSGTTCPVVR